MRYRYEVVVDTDTQAHADIVMTERLGHDEVLVDEEGDEFDYVIPWWTAHLTGDDAQWDKTNEELERESGAYE
jgi:hypothetical protein